MMCPLCGDRDPIEVAALGQLPVFANVLFGTASEAAAAPLGPFELVGCRRCGLLYNSAVDLSLLEYSVDYENSLHHSKVFLAYATELSRRLVDQYDLAGRDVVEIGPGTGEFLSLMIADGVRSGIGYDPSHNADPAALPESVVIHATGYPDELPEGAAAVLIQHVLEHLDEPAELLGQIGRSLTTDDAVVYIEVPDATYMVEQAALWDLIYEHLTYYSETTLNWACSRAGLVVEASGRSFGDQYLWNESRRSGTNTTGTDPDVDEFLAAAVEFGANALTTRKRWADAVGRLAADGQVAVWGAGSKGSSFLNNLSEPTMVSHVVDVSPAKHGRFIGGTAHQIVGPDDLTSELRHVVVMNPLYKDEIATDLASRGITPEIHSVL
ncbi:MAG: class I SAM-dependent methyltransferase [Actinobacteria bacterium]|nr:class I SAM-dependent methyltransferase [Actinomycetota bacterium]